MYIKSIESIIDEFKKKEDDSLKFFLVSKSDKGKVPLKKDWCDVCIYFGKNVLISVETSNTFTLDELPEHYTHISIREPNVVLSKGEIKKLILGSSYSFFSKFKSYEKVLELLIKNDIKLDGCGVILSRVLEKSMLNYDKNKTYIENIFEKARIVVF